MTFDSVDAPITAMRFEQDKVTVDRYQTFIIPLVITPAFDTDTVTFQSSDTGVATVSEIGEIRTQSYGSTTITATAADGKKTATLTLNVEKPVEATGITLNKSSLEVRIGEATEEELTLTATLIPANATNQTVLWSSSDRDVVTVSGGKLTLHKAGIATVTASTTNGKSAACRVQVHSDVYITDLNVAKTANNMATVTVQTQKVDNGTPVLIVAYADNGRMLTLVRAVVQSGRAAASLPVAGAAEVRAFVWNTGALLPVTEAARKGL